MVEDLFGGWKAVYIFEDDVDGSRRKVTAHSYREAKHHYCEAIGREPARLVGLEIK